MLAYRPHGLVDLLLQFRVQDGDDLRLRIELLQGVQQAGQRRTESHAVGFRQAFILVLTERDTLPGVVRAAEHEDDVGIAEHEHAAQETRRRHVPAEKAGAADGGGAPGVVLIQLISLGIDIKAPPGLFHLLDVVVGIRVERPIVIGVVALERGIGVSEYGDFLGLSRCRGRNKDQQGQDVQSFHFPNGPVLSGLPEQTYEFRRIVSSILPIFVP